MLTPPRRKRKSPGTANGRNSPIAIRLYLIVYAVYVLLENDQNRQLFEGAAIGSNSALRSSRATGAAPTSCDCLVSIDIVSMISARFYDQRRHVILRVHCVMAFRSDVKKGDGPFTPPEVVPAGGGLL
jgi:hypothetical protein